MGRYKVLDKFAILDKAQSAPIIQARTMHIESSAVPLPEESPLIPGPPNPDVKLDVRTSTMSCCTVRIYVS